MWSRRQITAGIASMLGLAPIGVTAGATIKQTPSDSKLTMLSTLIRREEELETQLLNAGEIEKYFEQTLQYRALCSEMAKTPANNLEDLLAKASHTSWFQADLENVPPESPQSALVKSVWRDLVRMSKAEVYDD